MALKTTLTPRDWGRMFEALGLAVIIGGILVLGPIVTRLLFLSAPMEIASITMTGIFKQYGYMLAVSIALIFIGEVAQLKFGSWTHGFAARMRTIFAMLMLAMMICSTMVLHPKMGAMVEARNANQVSINAQEFNQLHKNAKWMLQAEMTLAVLVLALLMLPVPPTTKTA